MNENNQDSHKFIPPSEQMLHLLVKGATEYALLLMDPEQRIIYWNQGAINIFGYEEDEILGRPASTIFTPEDVNLGVSAQELGKARDQGWADDERWHLKKDGSRFWASGVVTTMKDAQGNLIGYTKVLRDQTIRKATEDKLKSAVNELTHFNAIAAHDLQEPLRLVQMHLQLCERKIAENKTERLAEYIKNAREGTNRMRELLNDLLSYVRIDQSDMKIEKADASAMFDMAISNLKVAIDEAGATVTRTSFPIVHAMPTQLTQVFQNLVSNAIKYRAKSEHPIVLANCVENADEWVFTVCDNGIGIEAEKQQTVFEAFRRLHTREEYPGSGLGLYISRKIVERHGGRIWIESEEGKGTRVHFTVKRKSDDRDT